MSFTTPAELDARLLAVLPHHDHVEDALAQVAADVMKSLDPSEAPSLFPRQKSVSVPSKVVRCLGMVQDVQCEMIFVGGRRASFFSDAASLAPLDEQPGIDEEPLMVHTQVVYVIPLPGHRYDLHPPRHDDADDDTVGTAREAMSGLEGETFSSKAKRGRRPRSPAGEDAADPVSDTRVTRRDAGAAGASSGATTVPHGRHEGVDAALKLPFPPLHAGLRGGAVLYVPEGCCDDPEAGAAGASVTLRPNDVIEFVGVVTAIDPSAMGSCEDEEGALANWRAASLPAGFVDTVIACATRKIRHIETVTRGTAVIGAASSTHEAPLSFAECIDIVADSAVQGDRVAAEYLLLHLIACTIGHGSGIAVGSLPLMMYGVATAAADSIVALISSVIPSSVHMVVDQENRPPLLKSTLWRTSHDFDRNALTWSPLQLPSVGCHLTLRDVSVDPGSWEAAAPVTASAANGATDFTDHNRGILDDLVVRQVSEVDYTYHQVKLESDTSVLLLAANGPSNFCTTMCAVPLVPSSVSDEGRRGSSIEGVSRFVAAARQRLRASAKVESSPAESSWFVDDMVKSQREHPEHFRSTSLVHQTTQNLWMTLARCVAAASGSSALKQPHWKHMKELESHRRARQY